MQKGIKKLQPGKWELRIWIKGRETRRIIRATSQADATRKRKQLIQELELEAVNGPAIQPPTLRDYCVQWQAARKYKRWSTEKHYVRHLLTITASPYSDLRIADIRLSHMQALLNEAEGGWWTVDGLRRVLSTLWKDACAEFRLQINPMARVKHPSDKPDKEKTMLTGEQLKAFMQEAQRETWWYSMLYVDVATGVRFSELSALRWQDVSEDKLTFQISQYEGEVAETPKNKKRRELPMTPDMWEVLQEWRRTSKGFGYVWPGKSKAVFRSLTAYNRTLKRIGKRAGVGEGVSSHALRRTFNNEIRKLTSGTVLRSMTGHATKQMSDHNSSVSLDEKRGVIVQFEKALKGGGE